MLDILYSFIYQILYYSIVYTIVATTMPHVFSTLFYMFLSLSEMTKQKVNDEKHKSDITRNKILALVYGQLASLMSFVLLLWAKLMHSYDVVGLENIPKDKPALLIFYHGFTPSDFVYMGNHIYRNTGRVVRSVGDKFLFMLPGPFTLINEYVFTGPAQKCVQVLNDGHLLQIAPGGTREALYDTNNYEILWNNRCGFARVAKQANVSIIPIFTENIRQIFIVPRFIQTLSRPLYERIRLPVVPFLGGFPVKLTTHVGEPIKCSSAETPEELAKAVHKAMRNLIDRNQTIPGNTGDAFKARFG